MSKILAVIMVMFSITAFAQEKPNIVFMMADNLGYGDVGVYGGGELRGAPTPRIDGLAREGLRLTQFLVEPGCTPSRAATMTSRYSIRSGLSLVIVPGTPNTLAAEEVTMAEVMKTVGYDTAYFGKWHLGSESASLPHNQGFDRFYGIPNTTDETLYVPTSVENQAPLPEGFLSSVAKRVARSRVLSPTTLKLAVRSTWNLRICPLTSSSSTLMVITPSFCSSRGRDRTILISHRRSLKELLA